MRTVRYVGLFLKDPLAVPPDRGHRNRSVKRYAARRQRLYDHTWEIPDVCGYHPPEGICPCE
ncbi:hypothetical protein [Streptomyces sp. 147326]|uniref:hypothetical protein n=1 Tax=Streptomyces sp. 147326 TaxID=3074379 RepID=UPI003857A9F0